MATSTTCETCTCHCRESAGAGAPLPPPPKQSTSGWLVLGAGLVAVAGFVAITPRNGFGRWMLGEIGTAIELAVNHKRKRCRPARIFLIRHGESAGNIDPHVYSHTPDSKLPLTDKGWRQAQLVGRRLRAMLDADGSVSRGRHNIKFFASPFLRTQQTVEGILDAFPQARMSPVRYDPRLRECEFGNLQDPDEMKVVLDERARLGRFFYRFATGESGADVYDRVSAFWESLYREMDALHRPPSDTIIIVTHGLSMRMLIARYFRWSVDEFERVWNPANCEVWEMRKDMANHGRYRMVTPVRGWDEKGQNPMTMLSELFEHDHKHAMTSERLFETEWQRVKYRVRRFIRSWGRQ